jgi:hypothetical protein
MDRTYSYTSSRPGLYFHVLQFFIVAKSAMTFDSGLYARNMHEQPIVNLAKVPVRDASSTFKFRFNARFCCSRLFPSLACPFSLIDINLTLTFERTTKSYNNNSMTTIQPPLSHHPELEDEDLIASLLSADQPDDEVTRPTIDVLEAIHGKRPGMTKYSLKSIMTLS